MKSEIFVFISVDKLEKYRWIIQFEFPFKSEEKCQFYLTTILNLFAKERL